MAHRGGRGAGGAVGLRGHLRHDVDGPGNRRGAGGGRLAGARPGRLADVRPGARVVRFAALAWLVSRTRTAPPSGLSQHDTRFLRRVARRTWMYFDRFTGPEDNWLPPDNFQEEPEPVLAHRTSPTNIGFGLLSILAAYDFGYLAVGECLRRMELMLGTLERLPRYRGHFFNWYDTRTLAPLHPRYVSTVDSGNLAIALIVARRGLEELADAPPLPPRWREGLRDTAEVLREALAAARPGEAPAELAATLERQIAELDAVAENPAAIAGWLRRAGEELGRGRAAEDLPEGAAAWLQALRDQYRELAEEAALPDSGRAGQRRRIEDLAERCEELVEMDFGFLYDRSRHLLALGFNCENHRRDSGYYDLLASEARLSSYFGVARGLSSRSSTGSTWAGRWRRACAIPCSSPGAADVRVPDAAPVHADVPGHALAPLG